MAEGLRIEDEADDDAGSGGSLKRWLTSNDGLDLEVESMARDPAASVESLRAEWFEGLVEEDGFRTLRSAVRRDEDLGLAVFERLYGERGGGRGASDADASWRTHAALLVPGRAVVRVKLIAPPAGRARAESVFRSLLRSYRSEPAGRAEVP